LAQLVTSLLGTAVLPADLHAALLTRAGGNPLYTREYLNMVTERSGVISEPDRAAVEDLLNLLPGSVQAVIAARLDTLPASSKQLLQAAAVVGHTFWAGAVAALTGSDPNEVKSRLHELVRADYLRPSRSSSIGGESEYTFNHALIAYHQLPRAARAARHQHAGDWHAALTSSGEAGATGGQAAVIAHHYTEAHMLTQAAAGDPSQVAELAILASRWHGRAARQAQSLDPVTAESHTRTEPPCA
jgi:predicted ATPase